MQIDKKVVSKMVNLAKKSYENGDIPVSAVIINESGKVVAFGRNTRHKSKCVLCHAEVNAILKANKVINDWRLDNCYMLCSLEPCDMCASVIAESRIRKVYYFLKKESTELSLIDIDKELIEDYDIYKQKFNEMLCDFFKDKR